MSNKIKGEAIVLYVYDGSAYRPVACLTSNALSQTREIITAQDKCQPGVTQKQAGSMEYNISLEGYYIDTTSAASPDVDKASHDWLKENYMDTGNQFTWKMDTGLTDNPAYFGTAVLGSLDANFGAGNEFAQFSGTFEGDGTITKTDPNA